MSELLIDEGRPLQAQFRRPTLTPEQRQKRRELEAKYRAYSCNECGEIHGYERDAESCCPPGMVYVCPTCSSVHVDAIDAEGCEKGHVGEDQNEESNCPVCRDVCADTLEALNCCLWKTLSFAQRLEVADHVRFGRHDAARALLALH